MRVPAPSLLRRIGRRSAAYQALAGMETKKFLVFHWSAIVYVLQSLIGMVVFVFFWRALYANTTTLYGLTLQATIGYVLLVRIFQPLSNFNMMGEFNNLLREGAITHLLVRPLHMQLAYYVQGWATLAIDLGRQLPVLVVALLAFRLQLSTDPVVWAVFIASAVLGHSVLFFLDWILACVVFYTTSAWGVEFALKGLFMFLGGGLLPLVMMPDWLRVIAENTPLAQALYVPISLLSGLAPLSEAPRLLLTQLVWLAVLAPLSRLVFAAAIRRITVQGG